MSLMEKEGSPGRITISSSPSNTLALRRWCWRSWRVSPP